MLATGVTSRPKPRPAAQPKSSDAETRLLQQIERLEQSLVATQRQGDLYEESRLCNNIAKKYERLGEWRKALHFHHYDRQISLAAGDVEGYLVALNNMAQLCRSQELDALAEALLSEQLTMALQHQRMPQAFQAYSEQGTAKLAEAEEIDSVALAMKECLEEAAILFFKAHECLDNEALIAAGLLAATRRQELRRLRLEARLNDARLLLIRGNWEGALGKARSVLADTSPDDDDAHVKFHALGVMGQAYSALKEHARAVEECFDEQLKISRAQSDPGWECEALLNLGMAYRSLLDYNLALQTFYLYKECLKTCSLDGGQRGPADQLIEETLELQELARRVGMMESGLGAWAPHDERYLELAEHCHTLGAPRDALNYLREYMGGGDVMQLCSIRALWLATVLTVELKIVEEALLSARRLREVALSGGHVEREVEALLCLSDAYSLLPTLPGEVLIVLQRALELTQEARDSKTKEWEPQVMSKLAAAYQSFGMDQLYLEMREKCLQLVQQRRRDILKDHEGQSIERELQSLDYFATRKPSKSVMRLVDGNFNMTSRRTRGALKGPELKARSKPSTSNHLPSGTPPPSARRRHRPAISDNEEGRLGLADFIVDVEDEAVAKKRPHISSSKAKQKTTAMIRYASSSGGRSPPKERRGTARAPPLPPMSAVEREGGECPMVVDAGDCGDLWPGPIWPPSPKRAMSSATSRGAPPCEEQRSVSGGSRRTWGSGDPAALGLASVTRLYVGVEGETLMVPVIEDITERKTIAWLMDEVASRYEADFGRFPLIDALLTEEGARLGPKDALRIVLGDGQRITAKVVGFRTKTLGHIYRTKCTEHGVAEEPRITQLLQDPATIDLSSWCFDGDQFELVLRSLAEYSTAEADASVPTPAPLLSLILANNEYVGDSTLQTISTIKSLQKLDLSFTRVTRIASLVTDLPELATLSLAFCNDLADLDDFFEAGWRRPNCRLRDVNLGGLMLASDGRPLSLGDWHFLEALESLDLSFCHLDGDLVAGLAKLIRRSTSLRRLSLHGCQMADDAQFAQLASALEESHFPLELDLTGNWPSPPMAERLRRVGEHSRTNCKIVVVEPQNHHHAA